MVQHFAETVDTEDAWMAYKNRDRKRSPLTAKYSDVIYSENGLGPKGEGSGGFEPPRDGLGTYRILGPAQTVTLPTPP